MPKPNFVKKPIDKLLDEPLGALPNHKYSGIERPNFCEFRNCTYPDCVCETGIQDTFQRFKSTKLEE